MTGFITALAYGLPVAILTALSTAWYAKTHPWKPGRLDRAMQGYYERKLAAKTGLTVQERNARNAEIQRLVTEPPMPPMSFGQRFRHDVLIAVGVVIVGATIRLVFNVPHF